jgi:hypothetical protein
VTAAYSKVVEPELRHEGKDGCRQYVTC